jgi:hypothetical protein
MDEQNIQSVEFPQIRTRSHAGGCGKAASSPHPSQKQYFFTDFWVQFLYTSIPHQIFFFQLVVLRYGASLGGALCYINNPTLRLFSHTCLQ